MTASGGDLFDPRDFYVSLKRAGKTALLAGPFKTHGEALAMKRAAWDEAERVDPRAFWDSCGTCSLPRGSGKVGVLNSRLGL